MAFDPQKQKLTPQLFSPSARAGLSWRLFLFFLITFSIAGLSFLGLQFGYKVFLQNSIADYETRLEESKARISETEQGNLLKFYSQMENLRTLFRSHVYGSKVFPFLQATTHSNVAYSNASLKIPERQLSLEGVADSYATLVAQMAEFESRDEVERVTLGTASFNDGLVGFNVNLVFEEDFFLLEPSPINEELLP